MTPRPVLRARGLALGYGARNVIADVDLEVRPGESWFLIGPNGSGKTTLLKGLLGLLPPRSGSLERDPEAAARPRLGFVPQRCELNPTLPTTVREFVSLGFVGSGVARGERPGRLTQALAQAGLGGLGEHDYWSLSGGQRQRALVARALVRQPRLLLLDEPSEALDIASETAFLATLVDLQRREGVTLLFVTHKLALAVRYASHVALFDAGRVLAGPREQVLRPAEVERVFGLAIDLGAAAGPALRREERP